MPATALDEPVLVVDKKVPIQKKLHPRIAVALGVHARWHIPLQICRALSTIPAVWWGFRCAFTFLGELLRGAGGGIDDKGTWDVETRFRVTEVFLAILWVGVALIGPTRLAAKFAS